MLITVRTTKSNGDINLFGRSQLFGEARIKRKRERGGIIYSLSKLSLARVRHTPKTGSHPEYNYCSKSDTLLPILPMSMLQNHCIVLSSNPGFQKYSLINLKKMEKKYKGL